MHVRFHRRAAWILACGAAVLLCAAAVTAGEHIVDQEPWNAPSSSLQTEPTTPGGKRQLWPLDGADVALLAICLFCLSLAGGAGIGGGAILVPVFLLVRGWPTPTAVALSNVTILGGSFANFICNVNRHRANGARTIDWELILVMEPTTILGALFGAMLNKILPNYITTYLLAVMLTFMTLRLFVKGRETYNKETALLRAAKTAAKATHHAARALARQLSATGGSFVAGGAAAAKVAAAARQHKGPDQTGSPVPIPGSSRPADSQAPAGAGDTPPSVAAAAAAAAAADAYLARSASGRQGSFIARQISRAGARLQGPLLVAADTHADAPRVASGSRPAELSAGSFVAAGLSAAAAGSHSATGSGQAAAAASVAAEREASWLRGVLNEDSRRQLLGAMDSSALFQGDVAPGPLEPMVALPTEFSISSSSSEDDDPSGRQRPTSSGRLADADADVDVESGGADTDELRRPLLLGEDASDTQPRGHGDSDKPAAALASGPSRTSAKAVSRESCLPLPHFFTLLLLSAWVVASDIGQAYFVCGSWQYWATTLSVLAPVAVILLVFRQILLKKYRHDDLPPDHVLPEGELHWNSKTTLLYPLYCSTAGLIAGLFGIGGGVVKGPLMLELGVPADVAAATSATMIMFTAGSACVVYSRFGQILTDYALLFIILGFFVTLFSQLLTFFLVKLLGRRSIIVFMMVVLMGIACSIMYLQSFLVTRQLVQHPEELGHFGSICPPAGSNGLKALFQQLLALASVKA